MRNESICPQKDCTGMFLAGSFIVASKLQIIYMPFQRRMDKETMVYSFNGIPLVNWKLQSGKTTEIWNNIDESQTFMLCKKKKAL